MAINQIEISTRAPRLRDGSLIFSPLAPALVEKINHDKDQQRNQERSPFGMTGFLKFSVEVCLACVPYWLTSAMGYSCRTISRALVPERQYCPQSNVSPSQTLIRRTRVDHFSFAFSSTRQSLWPGERSSFRAIEPTFTPDATSSWSCATSARVQGRPAGRGPVIC
jgi:hypothetical protein